MKFLAIDRSAATEITANRLLQSIEYEAGSALAAFLQNQVLEVMLGPRLRILRTQKGIFLLGPTPDEKHFVVIDCEESRLFKAEHRSELCLLDAQKLLRFAIKFWDNLRFSVGEWKVPNTTRAVIFPQPISQRTNFRITIELSPDSRRQERRSPDDRSILVYRAGFDEGGGPQEEVRLTNFRLFVEDRRLAISESATALRATGPTITSLSVTTLDSLHAQINPYQGYQQWLELLTRNQKDFVISDLTVPHRIEGPAGTGKTLCLVLKAIEGAKRAEESKTEHKALFITHSEATRRTLLELIQVNDQWGYVDGSAQLKLQSIKLSTLQQLCGELLQRELSDSEFLDKDAMESKQLQAMHVEDALNQTMEQEYKTYKPMLSATFDKFLATTDRELVAEMFQHEISVVIKGRADEDLDNYRRLPVLKYGLPALSEADRGFVWQVFRRYQKQLQTAAQFDTDDIVLTTIGQLDTPIWRRRRSKEGYDAIYIDETHLFNVNELMIFHFLSRSVTSIPIAYSVDRTQAVGDRGWSDESFDEILSPKADTKSKVELTEVRNIFRCSPEIVDLAFSVTSSGATLFTNFNNPLNLASSIFTSDDERRAAQPRLITCEDDDRMIAEAFKRAELLASALDSSRCEVAVILFSNELSTKAEAFGRLHNKPIEILKQRGDSEVLRRAQQTRRFVLSSPDFVGGLEFSGVVLVGVDDGRVPPRRTTESVESSNFLSYAAHNRLYVAITRAKYRVEILVAKDRGPSSLLMSAIQSNLLADNAS